MAPLRTANAADMKMMKKKPNEYVALFFHFEELPNNENRFRGQTRFGKRLTFEEGITLRRQKS